MKVQVRKLSALVSIVLMMAAAKTASAHFVWVLPDANGSTAKVVMNETLSPSDEVPVDIIKGAKLVVRDADGKDEPLMMKKSDKYFVTPLPGSGLRVVHGVCDLGVNNRGGKTNVLVYYPKTILGDAFDPKTIVGNVPVELVPEGKEGEVKLKLLVAGKPKADAEIDMLLPDGSEKKVKTDANGETEVFSQSGRFGAWARDWQQVGGERDGKTFAETHNYAMVVFDAGNPAIVSEPAAEPVAKDAFVAPTLFAKLPEAASSFGAVAANGWLYIYGGHIVKTHSYSTAAVSGKFNRLNLEDGKTWETLEGGPSLQGMNLATYGGKIYRIGGMQPHNKQGEDEDVRSTDVCAVFDPSTGKWSDLPKLPEPRSSHDVAVVGNTLYVVGGWDLKGKDGPEWLNTMLSMDLASASPEWKVVKQPFVRRALICAAFEGKVYSIGGFDENDKTIKNVDIFDPTTGTWSSGPIVPGGEMNAFGPAACVTDSKLYISVADGSLFELADQGKEWKKVGKATPRIVHRIAPMGTKVLVIGGAGRGDNSNLIEAVTPTN